jgi:hypothetical protein
VKDITLTHPLAQGQAIDVSINTINSGRTPALEARLVETSVGLTETQADNVAASADRTVVAPNNNEVYYLSATEGADIIAGLLAKKLRFYVRGRIEYRDIFGRAHKTLFWAMKHLQATFGFLAFG